MADVRCNACVTLSMSRFKWKTKRHPCEKVKMGSMTRNNSAQMVWKWVIKTPLNSTYWLVGLKIPTFYFELGLLSRMQVGNIYDDSRTVARVHESVGNHSKLRNSCGGHALRLLEVDELRVLPGRCLICCCSEQQGSAQTPSGALSPRSHLAHTTPCLVGIPATRCVRGRRLLRRAPGWRRPSARRPEPCQRQPPPRMSPSPPRSTRSPCRSAARACASGFGQSRGAERCG
eukprot:4476776-Pleurochrysis_carterae.AAC.3